MEELKNTIGHWNWNLRFDLDVIERCLVVIVSSYTVYCTLNLFPECLGLWMLKSFLELWMTICILLAIARSSVQLSPKGKAVLITGKELNAF